MAFQKIEWNERYSIGAPEIDEQHKKMLEIVNDFMRAKETGEVDKVIKQILTELVEYTKYHFRAEEEHMKANQYINLAHHIHQHKDLIRQIVLILNNMKAGKLAITDDLYALLKNWLINHIIIEDKKYGSFLAKKKNIG